ncbi:transposable element Tcb1 transposase [Trichonephila clavipes]|uniref:Transposable element Tcb1 transposase n=1 Tax=Trichonephila clavipes TaxID=2585209 RepID=A0A8X6R9H8_TRICX|nr:transposable element Tcb1 transposase [Trichonephila clavipes]
MVQRKHLDVFLRCRIIGRLECGRTQLEVSEELRIAQSVISRLWQRFQDDGNSIASDLSRQHPSTTGTTVSRQTVYRRLGHIGLYARRPVRCVPLTATHCHLRLTWSRKHALWTTQRWSCGMFSDESRMARARLERNYSWFQNSPACSECKDDRPHLYRNVILEQHVPLFRGAMGSEFLFMYDNACPHRANIVDECLQSEDITRMDWPTYSPDLNPTEHVWDMLGRRIAAR